MKDNQEEMDLLQICQNRLKVLETQAEYYSSNNFNLPSQLLMNIEDTQRAISNLQSRISFPKNKVEKISKLSFSTTISNKIEELKHPNPIVRYNAVESLGNLPEIDAIEDLIKALDDNDNFVKIAVINTLGRLGDIRAVGPIINKLFEESQSVCSAAVHSLGQLCDSAAIEPLCKLLESTDTNVRDDVINTLPVFGELAKNCLLLALKNKHEDVRVGALKVLNQISDPKIIEYIIPLLKDMSSTVRGFAAKLLGERGDKSALLELSRLLDDNEEAWPEVSVKYVAAYSIKQINEQQ